MAKEVKNPTKLPYGPAAILEVEDRFAQIQALLREMRHKLSGGPLASVEWKLGTFLYYLSEQESLLRTLRGEFESQYESQRQKSPELLSKLNQKVVGKFRQ